MTIRYNNIILKKLAQRGLSNFCIVESEKASYNSL